MIIYSNSLLRLFGQNIRKVILWLGIKHSTKTLRIKLTIRGTFMTDTSGASLVLYNQTQRFHFFSFHVQWHSFNDFPVVDSFPILFKSWCLKSDALATKKEQCRCQPVHEQLSWPLPGHAQDFFHFVALILSRLCQGQDVFLTIQLMTIFLA